MRALRPLLPALGGLPRAYWHLWTGSLINRVGAFVVPFLALYLTAERHMAIDDAGLVVALYGVGSFAAGPAGGVLADLVGRKKTMVAALVLGSFAMLHLGFARAPVEIAVGTLCLGFFGDLYRPASAAMVSDLVPEGDRVRAYALLHWAANVGFSIAPVVAGLMARRGFTVLFVADAATTAACAVLIAWKVPGGSAPGPGHEHGASVAEEQAPRRRSFGELLTPYRDAPFLAVVFLTFIVAMMFQQLGVALPIDMRAHGVAEQAYGPLIAINGVMVVLLQPFAVAFVQRFRTSRVLATGTLFTGVGFGLTAFAHTPAQYAGTIALWTLGEIATTPLMPAVIANLSPRHLRGSYQGAYQMAWGAASFGAPVVGGIVLARAGAPALWCGCFVAAVIGATGHLALARPYARRVAELRATAKEGL